MDQARFDRTEERIREEPRQKKLSASQATPDKAKLLFFGAVAVALYYAYTHGGIGKNLIGVILVAGVVWWLVFRGKENPNYFLTEQEAKIALFAALRYKQYNSYDGNYEIQPGDRIMPLMGARLRYVDGKPRKWEVGFEVKKANGLRMIYSGEIDGWTGYLIGIIERPAGYTGQESPDIVYIKDPMMENRLRYMDAGGDRLNQRKVSER